MNRILKKAIFLQNNQYALPESRLAEYHGAVFAEEFKKRGVSATKMVLGDPETQKPISDLLSISSMEQRLSPEFWKAQEADLIVFYGGMNVRNIPVMKAIKKGNPDTILVLKMDAAYGPSIRTLKSVLERIKITYIKTRSGHWSKGGEEAFPASRPTALTLAVLHGLKLLSLKHVNQIINLFKAADYIAYENTSALEQAKKFFIHYSQPAIRKKIIWLAHPVRDSFVKTNPNTTREPGSVISIANWKHTKDLPLHAKATDIVLRKNPKAHFTIIGANGKELYEQIIKLNSQAASRVTQINEVSNHEISGFLQKSKVFMLCSTSEGFCSAVIEALCCGCSAALSCGPGVPCFKGFVADNCGTQATSRKPIDMANAVLNEFEHWEKGSRNSTHIKEVWSKTLVTNLCTRLLEETGFSLEIKDK